MEALGAGLQGFQTIDRQSFTAKVVRVVVLAGIIVDLGVRKVALVADGVLGDVAGVARLLVVEGGEAYADGLLLTAPTPLGQCVLGLSGGLAMEADGLGGDRWAGIYAVGDHQAVIAFAMAEIEKQSFLFHQPVDEVEVALSVLHAVAARGVVATKIKAVAPLGDLAALEHRLDHLGDVLVLEDAAVTTEAQQG